MSYILLGVTALILGLRHGTDIDHIAAILDMAGSSATEKTRKNNLRRILADMRFPLLYVIGHGLMVILLGVLALCFGAVIPHWFDQIMERIVGVTLLLLSAYLLYSLYLFATKGEEVKLKSRWMVLFAAIGNVLSWLSHKLFKHEHRSSQVANWDDKGALMIGAIHGFGAETGSQVLLFASVAGAGNIGEGLYMLGTFTVGMMISTLAIGFAISAGLASSRFFKPAMVVLGIFAAIFSLIVGLYFTFGAGNALTSFF